MAAVGLAVIPASAQDRLCDPGDEDCRAILINYIRNEQVGIDVGFWFMEDARYTAELIRRHQAGVPIRVLIDTRANSTYPLNASRLKELQNAGIPMRRRTTTYILHWKMMLFHGQNVVQFSGANYSANAWRPLSAEPYVNYIDEAIYFTGDTAIVDSFRTEFDDQWTDLDDWENYANVSGAPTRRYDTSPKDPSLNFPPADNFRTRSIRLYESEPYWIDVIMYRITDRQHTDSILETVARGVPVRLITEPAQYRDPSRIWHAWNVDRLYMGGVQIRHRAHLGLNHQKSVILYGQDTVIFGSSNWTSPSARGQLEHNLFTTKPDVLSWFAAQFARKWNNLAGVVETVPFVPLRPDAPTAPSPAHQAVGVVTEVELQWFGGPWAHTYDLYLGTTPDPPLVASDLELGPSEYASVRQRYAVPYKLHSGTTYYWRVVGKTMARQQRSSAVWSFTTGARTPPPAPALVSPIGTSSPEDPTFVWNAVADATHYYLWINDGTGTRFARWYDREAAGCGTGTGSCAIMPSVPLQPGAITWWIQTWSFDGGYGAWSDAGRYTLQALGRPTLIEPNGAASGWPAVQFRWEAVPGATWHYLWVNDAAGSVRVRRWYRVSETGCTRGETCSVTVSPTLSPGAATWWVQAWNPAAGYGPWSAGVRFTSP